MERSFFIGSDICMSHLPDVDTWRPGFLNGLRGKFNNKIRQKQINSKKSTLVDSTAEYKVRQKFACSGKSITFAGVCPKVGF
ncbi:MAG: hypothetical protein K2L96_05420 [Muribaculaceae bacterium]|nr:hypothetical protein [Muribaculaceae bacterium]